MSTDYYMTAVIGVRIEKNEVYTKVEEKNCPHVHEFKFCPECGKPAGTTQRASELSGFKWVDGELKYKDLDVVSAYDFDDTGPKEDTIVIGVVIGEAESHHTKGGRIVKCDTITDQVLLRVNKALKGTIFDTKERALYLVLTSGY